MSAAADSFAEGEPTKMAVADLDYVFEGTPPELAAEATAWRFPAGGIATAEQAAKVAAALGVSGEPVQLPDDQGGGWLVGPSDYTAPTVNVASDAMHSWWYSSGPSDAVPMCGDVIAGESGETIVEVAPDVAGSDVGSGGAAVSGPAERGRTPRARRSPSLRWSTRQHRRRCRARSQPPRDLPDEATARASATALLQALGLDPTSYEIEVTTDEWATSVNASLVLDGVRSNVTTYVGYGEAGEVLWAGGSLATPERADVYPLIGVAAGVDRLNEQADSWYGLGSPLARSAIEPALDAPAAAPGQRTGRGQRRRRRRHRTVGQRDRRRGAGDGRGRSWAGTTRCRSTRCRARACRASPPARRW